MDTKSIEKLESLSIKKQLALSLVGSAEHYDSYKKVQETSNQLYNHDLHYYNDTFYVRHDRNIEQIKKLIPQLKEGKVTSIMLLYNTWNCFYPSYVLHHHCQIYCKILELFSRDKIVAHVSKEAISFNKIGFYASRLIQANFNKLSQNIPQPTFNEDHTVKMQDDIYFYDKHTSLYAHHCCFRIKDKNSTEFLVFVNLRNTNGELSEGIKVKDLGATISPEYLQVGYNFNSVKPFLIIKIQNSNQIKSLANLSYFHEFNLSLLDLKKSLYLAIRYTSMRKQFKTLPQSKQQRPIITYQAVAVRLLNGFSKLVCFSELNKNLLNNKHVIPFASPLLDTCHHLILESVIRLRQCSGGFGYLQVAGYASCIEKLCLRSGEAYVAEVPQNAEILKRLHYFSSSDDMESYFGSKLTKQHAYTLPSQVFATFINICVNMRKSSHKMHKAQYLRQFMHQASIQALKGAQQFTRIPKDSLPFLALHYQVANYILNHGRFINWTFIQQCGISPEQYLRGVSQFRDKYLYLLCEQFSKIEDILEVDFIRNAIVGNTEDSEGFYHEVIKASRDNLRNSEEFVEYVKRPIVEMLAENNSAVNAKL